MELEEFKAEVRDRRGKLTKHDNDLEIIYTKGTEPLRFFTLKKKLMGVSNIAWVATQPIGYQNRFTSWMADKNWKADTPTRDLWFADNPGT